MLYRNAKKIMLDQEYDRGLLLLNKRQLHSLSAQTLGKLWRKVCGDTCDVLQGYHSQGCKQLCDEYWRRNRIKKKKDKNGSL